MAVAVLIARILLVIVFGVAGLSKLADPRGTRGTLHAFGSPKPLVAPLAIVLPVVELAIALALALPASAEWGALGALAVLALVSSVVCASLARGKRPECRCFGRLAAGPISSLTLARNGVFAALAALIAWQGPAAAVGAARPGDLASAPWAGLLALLLGVTGLTAGLAGCGKSG